MKVYLICFIVLCAVNRWVESKPAALPDSEEWELGDNSNDAYSSPIDFTNEKEQLNDCIEIRSDPGIYEVKSSGQQSTCGLYLVGPMDAQVQVDFLQFDVDCQNKGLIGLLDGWEQNGHVFPSSYDLVGRKTLRYQTHCGGDKPTRMFLSTGNMALIQYRLPKLNDGFVVRVQFVENPRPCNAISLLPSTSFTIRNYGAATNCSVLAIFPQKVEITLLDVGVNYLRSGQPDILPKRLAASLSEAKCSSTDLSNPGDYVEILGGISISVNNMRSFREFCGFTTFPHATDVTCDSTVIRLVSSGRYDNYVQVSMELLENEDGLLEMEKPVCSAAMSH